MNFIEGALISKYKYKWVRVPRDTAHTESKPLSKPLPAPRIRDGRWETDYSDNFTDIFSAFIAGTEIELKMNGTTKWVPLGNANWDFINYTYRVKPKPTKEQIAYANGEAVEYRDMGTIDWYDVWNPSWDFNFFEYRIKPKGTKEQIAFANGEAIEARRLSSASNVWFRSYDPPWNFEKFEYRIKIEIEPEQTKEQIAFANGEAIEFRILGASWHAWEPTPKPSWDFKQFEYRIKPKEDQAVLESLKNSFQYAFDNGDEIQAIYKNADLWFTITQPSQLGLDNLLNYRIKPKKLVKEQLEGFQPQIEPLEIIETPQYFISQYKAGKLLYYAMKDRPTLWYSVQFEPKLHHFDQYNFKVHNK